MLKRDVLGTVRHDPQRNVIVRESATAPAWIRPLARALAKREARMLARLDGRLTCPRLVEHSRERPRIGASAHGRECANGTGYSRGRVVRSYLPGAPLYRASFDPAVYFRDALRQLRRMHVCGVVHNDLAKEANWICLHDGRAGIVDFQIAMHFERRSRMFRTLAYEDLRHLLKHKRHYANERLTPRQRAILSNPQWPARIWRRCCKPIYAFVTRRLLRWPERHSAVERNI